MEADRVIAIGMDPSTASTYDVGRLAARVLQLEQAIDEHRAELGQRLEYDWPADVRLWSVADEDLTWTAEPCRHDAETGTSGGWVCDQCGEATHAATS